MLVAVVFSQCSAWLRPAGVMVISAQTALSRRQLRITASSGSCRRKGWDWR